MTQPDAITIRTSTLDDLPHILPIFREVIAAGESHTYPDTMTDTEIERAWFTPEPWRHIAAVDASGAVLGIAKWGPNHSHRGSHIANASFMVAGASRGLGLGRRLGEYVIQAAAGEGYDGMQFNAVVETNVTAVRLWQSLGFQIMTTIPGAFRHPRLGKVGLHIMYQDF